VGTGAFAGLTMPQYLTDLYAPAVALQANEGDAVSETNMEDTLSTENVQTAAGQQTISRQAVDRGTGIGTSRWRTCNGGGRPHWTLRC
jgi:hypothetical protein